MNDESNALHDRLLERANGVLELRGMKDIWPAWPQETAALMRKAAAQIESLARDLHNEREEHATLQMRCFDNRPTGESIFDEVKTLRAELDAAKQDAERYRWLREHHKFGSRPELTIAEVGMHYLDPWSGDDPDKA